MALPLDGPRLPPAAGGAAKQLVVFLHGYGADGNDLIGLGREWAKLLPYAAFVSPHAPEPCGAAPMGRQWFDLSLGDMRMIAAGVKRAAPAVESFLDAELKRHGLGPRALGLMGFSQGTMVALSVGLKRNPAPAAIVGYSGALATVEALPKNPSSAPAILLVHGPRAARASRPSGRMARVARDRARHRRRRPAARRRVLASSLRRSAADD